MTTEEIRAEVSIYGWGCVNENAAGSLSTKGENSLFNRHGKRVAVVSPYKRGKYIIKDREGNTLITGTLPGILHKCLKGYYYAQLLTDQLK